MTINDVLKARPSTSTPEERPFQVVLMDMKKAAEGDIYCIEKTLMGTEDLKFVAISYRWGELNEVTVDTHVGYSATLTSFGLRSLVTLCKMMMREKELKHMDYIWVDAICVDQTNQEKRKATVYQMTNIYNRANYILAVPDLHMSYLMASNRNTKEVISNSIHYGSYIYHLIQGDTVQLDAYDQEFLDHLKVPRLAKLRHLLTRYTKHFTYGFMNCIENDEHFDANGALDHILASFQKTPPPPEHRPFYGGTKIIIKALADWLGYGGAMTADHLDALTIDKLHVCDKKGKCPLELYHVDDMGCKAGKHDDIPLDDQWAIQIQKRSQDIRRCMDFLADLIKDWSMRAWVVGEYHIAKRKTNQKMKYWFLQLDYFTINATTFELDDYSFFEFDFNNSDGMIRQECITEHHQTHSPDAVYQTFHATLERQLNQQTFLEMMLKTKASRHQDRFHAILPSSEYKHRMTNKDQVDHWHITSLTSVKLQLYQWMTNKHKLELLFLSAISDTDSGYVLPTFATSNINWSVLEAHPFMLPEEKKTTTTTPRPYNFDLTNSSNNAIHLMYNKENGLYQLNIKPREYYRHRHYRQQKEWDEKIKATAYKLLELSPETNPLDLIAVPGYKKIAAIDTFQCGDPPAMGNESDVVFCEELWASPFVFFIGSFEKNKWILKYPDFFDHLTHVTDWEYNFCNPTHTGFDIY